MLVRLEFLMMARKMLSKVLQGLRLCEAFLEQSAHLIGR